MSKVLQLRVKRSGLTHDEIAAELGVKRHRLCKWGQRDPWTKLAVLAAAGAILERRGLGLQTDLEDFTGDGPCKKLKPLAR